jgi:hypothetical protein
MVKKEPARQKFWEFLITGVDVTLRCGIQGCGFLLVLLGK